MLALVNTPRLNEESPDQLRPGLKTAQLDAARAKPPQYGRFAPKLWVFVWKRHAHRGEYRQTARFLSRT
jgi:hypothetical protein